MQGTTTCVQWHLDSHAPVSANAPVPQELRALVFVTGTLSFMRSSRASPGACPDSRQLSMRRATSDDQSTHAPCRACAWHPQLQVLDAGLRVNLNPSFRFTLESRRRAGLPEGPSSASTQRRRSSSSRDCACLWPHPKSLHPWNRWGPHLRIHRAQALQVVQGLRVLVARPRRGLLILLVDAGRARHRHAARVRPAPRSPCVDTEASSRGGGGGQGSEVRVGWGGRS